MLNMIKDNEEPPSTIASHEQTGDAHPHDISDTPASLPRKSENKVLSTIKKILRIKTDSTLRETIEEYIEDSESTQDEESVSFHEKTLISNILELRDVSASDVMIPRADIVAINEKTTQKQLFALLSERQYSRIPVYKENLDNVTGSIHVKDIMATLAKGETVKINEIVRSLPIVSPSMHVLDLLLQMRITKKHMVLVVDEFGGIDGLITIGDVIEIIVGEIDDEHDPDDQPAISLQDDGSILADARYDLDEFEEIFGKILNEEEREDNETLGGLVFTIAGRVPARGEILTHETGMVFEILEADPRRINKLCIRNLPKPTTA